MRMYKLYRRLKLRKRKRKIKPQKGGLFGFEYLMHKLAGRKQNPNYSLHKALGG